MTKTNATLPGRSPYSDPSSVDSIVNNVLEPTVRTFQSPRQLEPSSQSNNSLAYPISDSSPCGRCWPSDPSPLATEAEEEWEAQS
jgi:hypothetical protein